MTHLKCVDCRIRLSSPGGAAEPADEGCVRCGSPLEPVFELTEVLGFQFVGACGGVPHDDTRGWHEQIVGDLIAHREAVLSEGRLDRERWLDDGGSFRPEPVAAAIALPVLETRP